MAGFDPQNKELWYFGLVSRDEANAILENEKNSGVFLVRDSTTSKGDLVLCVREDREDHSTLVSHYIVNKINSGGVTKYRIGEQYFSNMPALLSHYQKHFLDTTALTAVAPKIQVVGKFEFAGNDDDDLPFKKGEILTVLSKDEEQWWTAKNSAGQKGSIPVPYVITYQEHERIVNKRAEQQQQQQQQQIYKSPDLGNLPPASKSQRSLPAMAKVIQSRTPSAYDKTLLKLEVGEIVKVLETDINGQWRGIINGKEGYFPFTHVEFIDEELECADS